MERWIKIGSWATAVAMFGVVGFFAWSALTDPRRGEVAVATNIVAVSDNAFGPYVVEVETGTEVTFDFVGAIEHNVSFDDEVESPDMVSGTYTRSFDRPGVYDFVCTIHPLSMRGRVIATDG